MATLTMVGLAGAGDIRAVQLRPAEDAAHRGALAGAAALHAGRDVAGRVRDALGQPEEALLAVTVNAPPRQGKHAGRPDAVEVIVAERHGLGMARIALGAAPVVQARAVALLAAEEAGASDCRPAQAADGPSPCLVLAAGPLRRVAQRVG